MPHGICYTVGLAKQSIRRRKAVIRSAEINGSRWRLSGVGAPRRGNTPTRVSDGVAPIATDGAESSMELRIRQTELMDAPDLDEGLHREALRGLSRVNWISATVSVLWSAMRPLAVRTRTLRVLDVGCGAGDVLIGVARRAAAEGIELQGVGCDISPTAIKHAEQLSAVAARQIERPLNLEFRVADCLRDTLPAPFDVTMCSLFLHHLSDDDACQLLQRAPVGDCGGNRGRSLPYAVRIHVGLVGDSLAFTLADRACRRAAIGQSGLYHG